MRRVLIITYYWPPSGGSGVQRWVKFSKYLPGEGWQPVVYTPLNPEAPGVDHSLEADIPAEAEVIKRPIRELYGLYRKFSRSKSSEVNPINGQKKGLVARMLMFLRGNLFIPDPRRSWVRPSVRFLKTYLRECPVDVMVSTGPPHSLHLIARKLHAATGIPWVADFRDPWTKLFYFKHLHLSAPARRAHERLEKKVLDEASVVVAVSPLVQEEFRAMTATEVELVTNGFDPADFQAEASGDGFFNITHTGLFAADGNPDRLWKVLGERCRRDAAFRDRLRIRLCGKTDRQIGESIRFCGLGENLVDLGYVVHDEVVREQKKASLLILPLRKEPEYRATLPGKLFEYLASRRPLLGIGQRDGAMAAVLRETGAGNCCDWDDEEGMAAFLEEAWQDFLGGGPADRTGSIDSYSRIRTTWQMARIFDKLTN